MATTGENGNKVQPLSERQLEFVGFVEQCYWSSGQLPTNELVSDKIGVQPATISRYWQDSKIREALVRRGVDLRPVGSQDLLTPKQLLVSNMLLNVHDKRSLREKLEACDVTTMQYNAWLRQDSFRGYLKMRAEQMFAASDHVAYTSLIETMSGGDTQALKLFFEMRGIYTPKAQLDVNVESLMVRVVEIVAKHVTDPETLQKIADEIEVVAGGRPALPAGATSHLSF